MVSSTRRTAGCGPACPVVWQGRVGDHSPYADCAACSPFYAHDLAQRVDDFHEIGLRGHYGFNRLVSCGRLVDDVGILAALDARRHTLVVLYTEAPLSFRAGHGAACAVAAAHEAFHVALAANNIGARSHAPGNDAHVTFAGAHCTLARYQNILAVVALACHIVVVAIYGLELGDERPHFAGSANGADDLLHHQVTIEACKILRPFHRFDVIVEVLGAFREIGEILVR